MNRPIAIGIGLLLVACAACTSSGASDIPDGSQTGQDDGPGANGSDAEAASAQDATSNEGDATLPGTGSDGQAPAASCTGAGGLTAIQPLDPVLAPSALATDSLGNVYVAGSFKGTATLGKTKLTATGAVDLFLAKFDPSGNVLSANHWGVGTTYQDPSPVIAVDAANNVFLAGFFSGTLDFGGAAAPVTAMLVDAFVVKFDTGGKALWSDHFGYDQGPYAILGIAIASNGDPVVAGTAAGTIVIGTTTWTAPDPPGSGFTQGFVAQLGAADGSVVWSNASGGDIDVDHVVLAVDAKGQSFFAARDLSGGSRWGTTPEADGGGGDTLRVAFDPSGNPMWSQFDQGYLPMAMSVDSAGRVAIIGSNLLGSIVVGTTTFQTDESMAALLLNPADGTLLSGTTIPQGFPWAGAAASNGFTFVTGQYTGRAETFGSTVLPSPGPPPANEELFVAELDPTSHFVWAQDLGAGNTQPLAMAVGPDGRVLVAGNTDTAFTTSRGSVPVGNFLAVFLPPTCANDPGPAIPAGNGSHGDLGDAAPSPPDASPAPCPANQASATNGAACPVAMGCSYGSTCCFCVPKACGAEATTWTCDPLGTPNSACPQTPPAAGTSCPAGVQCNYCLPGGRYFADCTAGGWDVGYAQLLCQ